VANPGGADHWGNGGRWRIGNLGQFFSGDFGGGAIDPLKVVLGQHQVEGAKDLLQAALVNA